MFVLRRYSSDGVEINSEIGISYTIISKNHNPEQFEKSRELHKDDDPELFAYIYGNSLENGYQPLYRRQESYIMTGSGKTFCHLKHY